MGFIKNFRELIWPLLDPAEENKIQKLTIDDIKLADEDIDQALVFAKEFYNSERERSRQIESKSTIFIGSFGVTTAIILAVVKDIISSNSFTYNVLSIATIGGLSLIVIYLCRALWFSIKALARQGYNTLGYKDIITQNGGMDYKKQLIICLINNTRSNYNTTNEKVDNMAMAQEYFKRVLACIGIFTIFLLCYVILTGNCMAKVISSLNKVQPTLWLVIIVFSLILVCIIWQILTTFKLNKILKKQS